MKWNMLEYYRKFPKCRKASNFFQQQYLQKNKENSEKIEIYIQKNQGIRLKRKTNI